MYERLLSTRIRAHARSVLLLGPRQVGKSTLLRALRPDLTIDLASLSTFREYVGQPERFERELEAASPRIRCVMIDEVQRVPPLLDAVQSVLDAHPRRFRLLLSGSSARKLRRGQANHLPGRVVIEQLHPLLARELGGDFRLERVLAHGSLPGIYVEPDPHLREQVLRSCVDAYLREEVQAEALVRDIGGYARLLDLVAASSGRILNLHALSREAGISYETARRYLEVLEAGREAWGIQVKASRTVDARDLRGFDALADRVPRLKRRIVVFLGSRRQKIGAVEAIPLEIFLDELPA